MALERHARVAAGSDHERHLLDARGVGAAAAELHARADRGDRADRGRHVVAPAFVEDELEVDLDAERLERG